MALGINPAGTTTGYYVDANDAGRGYVRARDGTLTIFDVPGASYVFSGSINPRGVISGSYLDADSVVHGFLRATDGRITTFDAPGAGTSAWLGTWSGWGCCINPAGTLTGTYLDANGAVHGYVRSPDGTITEFDAPGAGTGAGQGTIGGLINDSGVIAGGYIDANGVSHGFLLIPTGVR